ALMPLAALPVEIAGRNRIWRRAMLDAIRNDPAWNNGEYTQQPPGLRLATEFESAVAGSALQMQKQAPTREAAEKLLEEGTDRRCCGNATWRNCCASRAGWRRERGSRSPLRCHRRPAVALGPRCRTQRAGAHTASAMASRLHERFPAVNRRTPITRARTTSA